MKNNGKIGLLVAVMLMGICNISHNTLPAQAKTEGFIITADEQKNQEPEQNQMKANKDTFEKAKSLMEEKDYNSAIEYLTAYINGKPKKYEAYKLRGECYYAMRRYDLARDDFQTAVDIKTGNDRFATGAKVVGAVVLGADKDEQKQNVELGNLYGQLMYAQKALNDSEYEDTYKKAFEYNSHIYLPQPKKADIAKINCPQKYGKLLTPTGIDADIQSVVENIEANDFHEAAYKVSKITSEYPNYYYGYYLTGVVMAGLEQEKDAIPSFEKAIEINPYDFESLASLGQIYYSDAEKYLSADYVNKSVEYFEKAIKLNPNCYIYHFYLGLNNLLLSRNDKAIAEFDKAISMKSNDYNSMYYKLIAQYLKGDDNGVVEGSDKLLNRHVSNSNSVLYLKALANYRLGKNDEALSNVEKAFANMNDLYNADIKNASEKEKTLPSYLYLLKAQILKAKGEDSSEDFAKAYENPIIKTMTRNINTEINISPADFENQLDYIRTAFIDKKVMMKYLGSEYKVSNLGPKDNSVKQESDDVISDEPSALALALATGELKESKAEGKTAQITMKQTTSPEEMMSENQSSISQMLAAQSVPKTETKEIKQIEETKISESENESSEFKITYDEDVVLPKQSVVAENNKDSIIVTADDDSKIAEDKSAVLNAAKSSEQIEKSLQNAENNVSSEIKKTETKISETASTKTIIIAPVQKQTENFNIKYDKPTSVVALNKESEKAEEAEEIAKNVMSVNSFENMDEPIKISENKQEVLPVISAPVVSQKPVEYLPTSKTSEEDSVKVVAKEIKDSQDFKISYDDVTPPPKLRQPETIIEPVAEVSDKAENVIAQTNEIVNQEQKVQEDITKLVESHLGGSSPDISQVIDNADAAEAVSQTRKINEKYANVDLNEFNVQKPVPVFDAADDVVVFEPNKFMAKAEEELTADEFKIKDPTKQITDNFSQIQKQAKEYVDSIIAENNTTVAETQEKTAKGTEDIKQAVAQVEKVEKEPELIVPEAVVADSVKKADKEAVKVAVKTIEKESKVVPTVKTEEILNVIESPKEDVAAAKTISEAQAILDEFESQKQSSAENVTENVVKTSENKELWDFLSDDFDAEAVSKAKDKKLKKLNKRSKKEAQIASIVQETLTGDNVNDILDSPEEPKSKKSWFKKFKKSEKAIEDKSIENASKKTEKKTKTFKNIFKKNKAEVEADTGASISKVKNNWFKRKKNVVETVDNTVQKEQKKINWFRKKEKVIENSENNIEPKKEKKTFSLKNLFRWKKKEK